MLLASPLAAQGGSEIEARARAANALLSAALPGAGQLRADRWRGWIYLGVEALAWTRWAERRHRAGELRDDYRDLAWDVARLATGPRIDGDFSYYETLTHWVRSGAFDRHPDPGLQPEEDPTTFNGTIWSRAVGLFLAGRPPEPTSPGYDAALAYYETEAYGAAFLWDWSSDPTAQTRFAGLIRASDDRYRQATTALGVVLANHVVAAADALLTGRPRPTDAPLRVAWEPRSPAGWMLLARFGVPF